MAHDSSIEIVVLCSSRNNQLLEKYPLITNTITFDIHNKPHNTQKDELLQHIKSLHFDICINLWAHPFYLSLGKKAGIPLSVGPKISPFSTLIYKAIDFDWANPLTHEIYFNFKCIEALNIKPILKQKIYPTLYENAYSDLPLNSKQKSILFFCNSGKDNCMISEHQLLHFIKYCSQNLKLQVIITYGNADYFSDLPHLKGDSIVNITESLPLKQLICVMSQVNMYFGPDTGPSHIASFLNKKCVFLYKSNVNPPIRWGAFCDIFNIIRLDYISESKGKELRENHAVLNAIEQLKDQPISLNDEQKRDIHLKTSFRIIWSFKSKKHFYEHKTLLSQKLSEGWVVFPHIKRKNPFANIKNILFKCRKRNINAWHLPSSIVAKTFNFFLYTQAKPRLLFIDFNNNKRMFS